MTFLDENRLKKPNTGKRADPDTSGTSGTSGTSDTSDTSDSDNEGISCNCSCLDDVAASVESTADVTPPLGPFDNSPEGLRNYFGRSFPTGATRRPTQGDGLLCGLHAVCGSWRSQMPPELQEEVPSVDALLQILDHPEYLLAQSRDPEQRQNRENFYLDQLALIIKLWADTVPEHKSVVRVGCALGYGPHFQTLSLPGLNDLLKLQAHVLWIHHDHAQSDWDSMNHHEMLEPLHPEDAASDAEAEDAAGQDKAPKLDVKQKRRAQKQLADDNTWRIIDYSHG
ncbi:hypothetical protein LTR99_007874 [Exophiala xenobiotica]|uniref:Ubiquitinyl hydrolase 1 n=1 Tax=Vermiconidia calcicola TaxID=1690605 RepID=A0AAV9Q3L7_9PEZI|nr:hypothetical protein LTR72_005237 [Exophiala xenobiotica]KAK5534751.1 hypothetical protein LTR23_008682 [Chaetothyriales sp. CCFEE 6169]KAK5535156.1 hypothetical protein LTR25_006164 [Vermiconidia calcicola]KAK5273556.1 hypothetical protein LTR96_000156 [Exophiala xenobiotica]KAK5289252.1 hypothetical protein LTR14_007503 [Exophiala xenobiotica]